MLEYDNFKELICNELQRSLDREDFFVELKISDADNTINKKKDKLSVVDPARPDAFPIFYLNDIYKYYNECGDMYITVKEVVNEVKRAFCNIPKIEFDKTTVKDRVYFALINCDRNEKLLKHIPHRNFYDLAIAYRVELTESSNYLVTNKVMSDIGLSENDLYMSACKNTPEILGEICCMELDDWYMNELRAAIDNNIEYKESENLEEQSDPVYVFKFQKSNEYGSGTILYSDALDKLANKLEDNLVMMFPNSDELVVASASGDNIDKFNEFVGGDRVPAEKVLSDKRYIYDRQTKMVSIDEPVQNRIQHRGR